MVPLGDGTTPQGTDTRRGEIAMVTSQLTLTEPLDQPGAEFSNMGLLGMGLPGLGPQGVWLPGKKQQGTKAPRNPQIWISSWLYSWHGIWVIQSLDHCSIQIVVGIGDHVIVML